eukprot:Phypoly_transcript_21934.p1 GENE.Phypoly_transcript_21934~~Phypoly_transcript_21934.p1  ORF type:complete len:152 (+),score=13.05 Phypoly_transcript_21934:139-594(+)
MRAFSIIIFVLLLGFVSADIWSSCDTIVYNLNITNVTISPSAPVAGHNLTIAFSGNLDKNVTNGTQTLVIKYAGFITILSQTSWLCDGHACPISAGNFSTNITSTLDGSSPVGQYNYQVTLADEKSEEISCFNIGFSLSKTNGQSSLHPIS